MVYYIYAFYVCKNVKTLGLKTKRFKRPLHLKMGHLQNYKYGSRLDFNSSVSEWLYFTYFSSQMHVFFFHYWLKAKCKIKVVQWCCYCWIQNWLVLAATKANSRCRYHSQLQFSWINTDFQNLANIFCLVHRYQ